MSSSGYAPNALAQSFRRGRTGLVVALPFVGFDNIHYTELCDPPPSTVSQPAELVGERAMRRLVKLLSGTDVGTAPEVVPHRLVIRASTAPPPRAPRRSAPA